MKIVVLNALDNYVEVWPVPDTVCDAPDFDATVYLSTVRRTMDNIVYHCFDNDVPVFWTNETIPYTSL